MSDAIVVGSHVRITEDCRNTEGACVVRKDQCGTFIHKVLIENSPDNYKACVKLDHTEKMVYVPCNTIVLVDDYVPEPKKLSLPPEFLDSTEDFDSYVRTVKVLSEWATSPLNPTREQLAEALKLAQCQISGILVDNLVLRAKIKEWEKYHTETYLEYLTKQIYADPHVKKEPGITEKVKSSDCTGEEALPCPCDKIVQENLNKIAGAHGKPNSTEYTPMKSHISS